MTALDRRFGVSGGTAVKAPCRAATTGNISLSGEQTIDGVGVVEGDRVLVKDQSTATQNGIYVVSTGNWSRALDFDGTYDVVKGTRAWVHSGSVNANMEFVVTTADPITIDSSNIAFAEIETLLNAAPGNADYLVRTANGSLSAERVVTDTVSVTWDWATSGQAKANVVNAGETVRGAVELATNAEAIAGADTERAVTPAALAATIQAVSPALPRGYHDGCTIANNGSDATNDIDLAPGVWRDSTNTRNIVVASAMTGKRLDANWAAGAGNGMRNSASAITNGTYHLYLARTEASEAGDLYAYAGADGTDALSSATISTVLAALQAETGGSTYAYLRYCMSIIRSGGTILPFFQDGDDVTWTTPISELNLNASGGLTTGATDLALSGTPAGIKAKAKLGIAYSIVSSSAAEYFALVTSKDALAATPSGTAFDIVINNTGLGGAGYAGSTSKMVRTNASRQVRYQVTGATTSDRLRIVSHGYTHPRGKDA